MFTYFAIMAVAYVLMIVALSAIIIMIGLALFTALLLVQFLFSVMTNVIQRSNQCPTSSSGGDSTR